MKRIVAIILSIALTIPVFAIDQKTIDIGLADIRSEHSKTSLISWGGVAIEGVGIAVLVAAIAAKDNSMTPILGSLALGGAGLVMSLSVGSKYMAEMDTIRRYEYVDEHLAELPANDADDIWAGTLKIGASPMVAIAIMGEPKSVNVTQTAYGRSEQWVYGLGTYLYFDNGVLTGYQH